MTISDHIRRIMYCVPGIFSSKMKRSRLDPFMTLQHLSKNEKVETPLPLFILNTSRGCLHRLIHQISSFEFFFGNFFLSRIVEDNLQAAN